MTAKLARCIRLARNRIYGTPFDEEAERQAVALDKFQIFIARKIEEVRFDLLFGAVWQFNTDGCSVQFTVDEVRFVLTEKGRECELLRQTDRGMIPLEVLLDDNQFQDRLLIAIDDSLHGN